VDDLQIRNMISYVIKYFNRNCPENLGTMIHLIGHDERYRKRVEEITEAIIDHHDELFVACSGGTKVEDITPKFAEQCEEIRKKMKELLEEYLLEYSKL
jgi:hypothetical protein